MGRGARDQAPAALEQQRDRVQVRDHAQPVGEQVERHEDGSEEEAEEDRKLHQRRRLHCPQPHGYARRPEQAAGVDQHRERVEREDVDTIAPDLHPGQERDTGQNGGRQRPPPEGADRVAEQDSAPIGGRQHQAAREAALEVAHDAEPGEDTRERRGLEQHEDELKSGVADGESEARHVVHAREPAGEGGEEEERERKTGEQQRRVREVVVQHPPCDCEGDVDRPLHVRANLPRSATDESASPAIESPMLIENASASACASQPKMTRLRMPSIRYETGFTDAVSRNQSVSIRFRGRFIDERKRKTKKTGKRLFTASVEPVLSAAKAPNDAKASTISTASTKSTAAPAKPDSSRTPITSPTPRYQSACTKPSTITPPR